MSAAAEVQAGFVYLNGIYGAITMTGTSGSPAATDMNTASRTLSESFKLELIPSSDGTIIEAGIASQRQRNYDVEFAPKGSTHTNAIAVVTTIHALGPLAVITIAGSSVTAFNGTYNLLSDMQIKETREGYATISMKLAQFETSTAGAFAALTPIAFA